MSCRASAGSEPSCPRGHKILNSEFDFPIRASVNPKDIYGEKGKGVLGAALQILASQKVDIKYDGSINVGKGAINFTVPVVDSLSIPVKFNF